MDSQTRKNLLKIVRQNYRTIAPYFNETRKKHIWPELKKLAREIDDNAKKSIMDIGCGNGRLYQLFENKNVKYLGVDNCPELLEYARENFQNKKNEIEFVEGDILELNKLPQINFDYVFAVAVLHHLPSYDLRLQALKQAKNKLKPGGELYLTAWNFWSKAKFRKLIFKFWLLKLLKKHNMDFGDILFDWKAPNEEVVSQRYYHAMTKRELKKLLKDAGFEIKSLYSDKYNYYAVAKK